MKLWPSNEASQGGSRNDHDDANQSTHDVADNEAADDETAHHNNNDDDEQQQQQEAAMMPVTAPLFPPLASASEFCAQNGLIVDKGGPSVDNLPAAAAVAASSSSTGNNTSIVNNSMINNVPPPTFTIGDGYSSSSGGIPTNHHSTAGRLAAKKIKYNSMNKRSRSSNNINNNNNNSAASSAAATNNNTATMVNTLPPNIMSLLPPNTQEIHVYPPGHPKNLLPNLGLSVSDATATVGNKSNSGGALFGSSASASSPHHQPVFKFNTPSKNNSNNNNHNDDSLVGEVPSTKAAALSFGQDFKEVNEMNNNDNASSSAGGASGSAGDGVVVREGTNVTATAAAELSTNNLNNESAITNNNNNTSSSQSSSSPTNNLNNNNNNTSSWKPQSITSTCEFSHIITSYSQKRDSGCKKAEYSSITTDTAGNKWRLIIYVNGNGRASNHHLSLFLQVADAEELPFGWNKAVSYVLTLEHPNDVVGNSSDDGAADNTTGGESHDNGNGSNNNNNNNGYSKRNPDKTFKMCPKAIDWGWSQFIASDRILREGYVDTVADTVTVRASVTVKSSGVEIDPEDAELYLKCAVEEGNVEGVKACLMRDASVNCQFKDDLYTPLHTACSVNNGDSSSSASINSSSNGNSSPGPIPEGSLDVLELLLEQGADVNACNKWRETPLLIAANNGHCDAVRALLRSGADPGLCSEAGWSALTFAAHKGYDEIVSALLHAGAPVDCRVTEDLSTPLHKACAGSKPGHLSAVHLLLEGDADVHALNKWRETPLLTAANHGQVESVEALIDYGADPCKCTDTGWSPLSIAAYKGHDEVVRLLLEEGAPTEEDDPTLSALLQAATKGLPDTVMLLLEHGADHTVTTKKGDTALAILVEQNLIDSAVEMVTDYNASIPRCSRDRKKVQRARLLINLRLKQMQRDGTGPYCDDTDEGESSDADEFENSSAPLHHGSDEYDDLPSTSATSKKKKGKKNNNNGGQKSIAKAEAEARAAEEALLLELEAEEKERNAATEAKSAKKKKQKKKEKERMLREAEKAKEEAAALAAQKAKEQEEKMRLQQQLDATAASPMKKEVVIEITSNTVVKSAPEAAKADETGKQPPNHQKSTSKSHKKKESAPQQAKNTREPAKVKAKEVTLPKNTPAGYSVAKAEKKVSSAKNTSAVKKIPGDNPMPRAQPKRIPGDNPVVKKIPGDNPKVPVQQSRRNVQPMASALPTQPKHSSPTKSKRGWESKAEKEDHANQSTNQPKAKQQKPQSEKKRANGAKEKDANAKSTSAMNRKEMTSPSNKNKAKSDESTHSTANSTANDSLPPTPTDSSVLPQKVAITPKTSRQLGNDSVDDQLANMANNVLGFLDFDAQPAPEQTSYFQEQQGNDAARQTLTPPMTAPVPAAHVPSVTSFGPQHSPILIQPMSIELPPVSAFRLEKINELFRRCSEARSSSDDPLRVIDEYTLRVVLYRWIIRASHGADPFIDPVIPSWDDEEFLKAFLQRQFISENRRTPAKMNVHSIEVLRDAGAAMSELCISLAKEVSAFQAACVEQLPSNWSDADINVTGIQEGGSVIIDWSGKSRLSISFSLFNSMAKRYIGERNRLMAAVFSAVRRHEIIAAIVEQTSMISQLPSQTIDSLTKGFSATLETLADSVSVHDNNSFCTMFPDVDEAFGGMKPFAKEKGGGESVLIRSGGSAIVVTPPENATASQCMRKVIDLVETSTNKPLSFSVILSADCFVNAGSTLSVEDLRTLDPRLCGEHNSFITYVEEIPSAVNSMCGSSSMFMLIQNETGRRNFQTHPSVMESIRSTMRTDVRIVSDAPVSPSYSAMSTGFESSAFVSMPQHSYSVPENPFAANPFAVPSGGAGTGNRGRGHRGRLFDLVGEEDADEDQMNNIFPMLDGLNMFGNSNANEDVDIEAISLMGIGMNGMNGAFGGNKS
eukprot:scaffold56674_cov56-Cyclotella_meneghiniana.AAC.5